MDCGIYKITIGPRGFYFGSSKRLRKRHHRHLYELRRGVHSNIRMQRAWDKYQELTFEVVEYCAPEQVIEIEQRYLDAWIGHRYNFNHCKIAGAGCGHHTEESRRKISAALKGKKKPAHAIEALRYKRSDETRRKMSEAAKNRSAETIEKIRANMTGRPVSEETRRKISESLRRRHQERLQMAEVA